jgi:hypothetical protein
VVGDGADNGLAVGRLTTRGRDGESGEQMRVSAARIARRCTGDVT